MKETKTVTIKVRIEPTLKAELKRFAGLRRVDMSDVVRLGCIDYMDRNHSPVPVVLPYGQSH